MPEETANTETPAEDGFEWAIVQIFGHINHAGKTREEERFGNKMLRIDVPKLVAEPTAEGKGMPSYSITGWTTHWYGGSAIFSFTLTDEATALRANKYKAEPAQRYIAPPDRYDGDDFDEDERPF